MAIHSPAATSKLTPSSARTVPNSSRHSACYETFTGSDSRSFSPRKISAGRTRPSRRKGNAPASATAIISPTVTGKTIRRGEMAVAKTRCPIHAPAASPRRSRRLRRRGRQRSPPPGKIASRAAPCRRAPSSVRRRAAARAPARPWPPARPARSASRISNTVANSSPRMRSSKRPSAAASCRTGRTSSPGSSLQRADHDIFDRWRRAAHAKLHQSDAPSESGKISARRQATKTWLSSDPPAVTTPATVSDTSRPA